MAIPTTYETIQLTDRLKKLVADEDYRIVSYAELSKICGHDVQQSKGRGYLNTAREICERETNRLIDVARGDGVKLLTAEEQAGMAPHLTRSINRKINKGMKRLRRVQFDKLDEGGKVQHNVTASVLGTMQMFGRKASIKKITATIQEKQEKLAIGDTLKLFGG